MAEARQAVGFKLVVRQDGALEWDFDIAAALLVVNSVKRSVKKRTALVFNNVKNTLFPFKLELILVHFTLLTIIYFAGFDLTFGVTQKIISRVGNEL